MPLRFPIGAQSSPIHQARQPFIISRQQYRHGPDSTGGVGGGLGIYLAAATTATLDGYPLITKCPRRACMVKTVDKA